MFDIATGRTFPDEDITFYDGFLYILSCSDVILEDENIIEEWKCDRLILCAEADKPLSLKSIKEKYPDAIKVLFEDSLDGAVYTYGNHPQGERWEKTGTLVGYA